jgi:putative tributyrin esterase
VLVRLRYTVLSLCLIALACNRKQEATTIDTPRLTANVTIRDVTFHSEALRRDVQYRVVLHAKINTRDKFPVIYLLHGNGGNFQDWSNYSDVAQFAERRLILVMPEGHSSHYVNAAEVPEDRYEDFIVDDLIPDVERRFPANSARSSRAVIGVSMGGYGAVKMALSHPGLFVFAGGLSSAVDVPSRPFSIRRAQQYRRHSLIFGPWSSEARRSRDPFVLARSIDPTKVPFMFLTCGDVEGLLATNRQFAALLAQRRFAYEFHTGPGTHDWNQWNQRLPQVFGSLLGHIDTEK